MSGRLMKQRQRVWHLVNAKDEQGNPLQVVGRLAGQVAALLQGKSKPLYKPHADCGDEVVVVNARHAMFSGNKLKQKMYYKHSGYPGGLKARTAREIQDRAPEKIIELAVKRMLPDNRMRKHNWMPRLRIYADEDHPHLSQVTRSSKYAPGWLEYSAPASKKVESDAQIVPFRDDVFDAESPVSEWQPGTLSPEVDDRDEIADVFREKWQEEIEFWAARGQTIPEHIYELHGIPRKAGGVEGDVSPDEARAAFQSRVDEFRKERDADPKWKDFFKGVGDGAAPGSQEQNPIFDKYKLAETDAKDITAKVTGNPKKKKMRALARDGPGPSAPAWRGVPGLHGMSGAGWKTVFGESTAAGGGGRQ